MKHKKIKVIIRNDFAFSKTRQDFSGIILEHKYVKYVYKGLWHRIDGPALIYENNNKHYYIHGIRVTKEEQEFLYDLMKLKGLK